MFGKLKMPKMPKIKMPDVVGKAKDLSMPATKGNDQIIDMEPARYYQTIGIPLKSVGEMPPTHKYLTGANIENLSNLSEDLTIAARHALLQIQERIKHLKRLVHFETSRNKS